MKATERHKLKSNEFADSLQETWQYITHHGTLIMTVTVIVVALGSSGFWWSRTQAKGKTERANRLQGLIDLTGQKQELAAESARLESAAGETDYGQSYDISTVTGSLVELAREEAGSPVGMMALLQEAEAVRSELVFSDREITEQERQSLCDKAEGLYERVISEYPRQKLALGISRIGLGLLAEERGQWDKAKEIYDGIVADEQDKLAGTFYPMQARKRLEILDKINVSIEFPDEPVEIETPTAAEDVESEAVEETAIEPEEDAEPEGVEVE